MKTSQISLPLLTILMMGPVASGAVIVDSINDGDGQDNIDMNVFIDEAGGVSTGSPWFSVSGSVTQSGAFGGSVGFSFDAAKNMMTSGSTIGDELENGTFDRDGAGFMGVQGAPNAGGIGGDVTNHEGISVILDELSSINPSVGIRITGIDVQNIGREGNDPLEESFTVVNILTRESVTITPMADGVSAGTIDLTGLDIFRMGGEGDPSPVLAIFSGDTGGFRVDGVTFETFAVPEPSVALLGIVGLMGFFRRSR